MAVQKLYAGAKLRDLRTRLSLTQKDFAAKLGVSLPYLNQMENNNRPLSTTVVLALVQEFGFDVSELSSSESERLVSDMREALADPVFAEQGPGLADLRLTASNAPSVARAFLELHAAYRRSHERLASLDAALGRDGGGQLKLSPWEEVRDFFHYCDNYIDAVDRAAEHFAQNAPREDVPAAAENWLADQGITLRRAETDQLRHYDEANRVLTLSRHVAPQTSAFQLVLQVALLSQGPLIQATLDLARFQNPTSRDIAHMGLANYFAGAALMPYGRFLEAAQHNRHDLERLATQFGTSIEQVAHRLSTLQRPGAKGIPVFFVRVDQAGTITKRHSATRLQFARYGGGCPLWNVHRAFEAPGQFLLQLAETPDGARYFSVARDISKSGGRFGAPMRRYAMALGCEIEHASALCYADGLDLTQTEAFEPIGISCRICERTACPQRAHPPLEQALHVNPNIRDVLPYRVG